MDKNQELNLIEELANQHNWEGLVKLSDDPEFSLKKDAAMHALHILMKRGMARLHRFMEKIREDDPYPGVYGSEFDPMMVANGAARQQREQAIRSELSNPDLTWKTIAQLAELPGFAAKETAIEAAVSLAEYELRRMRAVGNWREMKNVATLLPAEKEHPVRVKAAEMAVKRLLDLERWPELLEMVQEKEFPLAPDRLSEMLREARGPINKSILKQIGKPFPKPEPKAGGAPTGVENRGKTKA